MSVKHRKSQTQEADQQSARIVHYDADTFNAAMALQVQPHPLSPGEGLAVCITVGGMSRRLGIAMNLFHTFYKANDGDVEEAAEDALEAAQVLVDMDREIREGESKPDGLPENGEKIA